MPRVFHALVRFISLDAARRRAFLAAGIFLSRAWLIYRSQSAAALVARLRDASARSRKQAASVSVDAERMVWALSTAARWLPFRADCLIQALAADLWLERRNAARSFHLAVARAGDDASSGAIAAHAWLEVDGKAVSGGALAPDLVRFAEDGNPAGTPSEKAP